MTDISDKSMAALTRIAEDRFAALLDQHPEIKSVDAELVAAIFQAGLEVGCATLIEVVDL